MGNTSGTGCLEEATALCGDAPTHTGVDMQFPSHEIHPRFDVGSVFHRNAGTSRASVDWGATMVIRLVDVVGISSSPSLPPTNPKPDRRCRVAGADPGTVGLGLRW
jgi:hypothetical protein